MSTPKSIQIEFDGGSTCNNPRLGYGIGYGSYRIDGGAIIRWNEGRKMSANAGEIWTLLMAVQMAGILLGDPAQIDLQIRGDSRIALKWARQAKCPRPHQPKGSHEFQNAILALFETIKPFRSVKTEW